MSPNHSISETSKLYNFLISLSFALYFSKPALRHIEEFIIGAVQFGYRGKVIDIVTLSHAVCHRTTYGKFLSQGAWNGEFYPQGVRIQIKAFAKYIEKTMSTSLPWAVKSIGYTGMKALSMGSIMQWLYCDD